MCGRMSRNLHDFDILTSINSNFIKLKQVYYIKFIVSNIKKDIFSFENIYLYRKSTVFNKENSVFSMYNTYSYILNTTNSNTLLQINKVFCCSSYYFSPFSPFWMVVELNSYLKSRKKEDTKHKYLYFTENWLLKYLSYIKNRPKFKN